jgi:hypothetical protein
MVRYPKRGKIIVLIVAFVLILVFGLAILFSQSERPIQESSKDITISYSTKIANSVTTKSGDEMHSDSGKYFLIVNMTIKNNGYDNFGTYPYFFHLIADNITYDYYFNLLEMENWENVDIRNGGTFEGTLVFQLPESVSSFTLDYDAFQDYNIFWNEI